jgi:hypothetical protein
MNTRLIRFLIVSAVIASLLWILVHQLRSEQKTIDTARRLIQDPAQDNGAEIVFRKPRVLGYMLIVFFVAMCCLAAYSVIHNWGTSHTTADRLKGLFAGFLVLIALNPLIRGVRDLRYTIRISPDELIVSDRTTRSVPLRDVKEVLVKGSFCQIRLVTGVEDLRVASDLKYFPEFVSLLGERVNALKPGGNS